MSVFIIDLLPWDQLREVLRQEFASDSAVRSTLG